MTLVVPSAWVRSAMRLLTRPPAGHAEFLTELSVAWERCYERGELRELYFPAAPWRAPQGALGRFKQCHYAVALGAMREQPLGPLPPAARAAYRLVRFPSWRNPSVVRITKRSGVWEIVGRLFGVSEGIAPRTVVWERTRLLNDVETARLERLLRNLRFWRMPAAIDHSGLDGTSWFLEGTHAGVYHLVYRWSPEEASLSAFGEFLTAASGTSEYRPIPRMRDRWLAAAHGTLQNLAEALEKKEREKAVERSNERSSQLAAELAEDGLTCPHCGTRSREIRFFDKSPASRSYFICRLCGRSFHPE